MWPHTECTDALHSFLSTRGLMYLIFEKGPIIHICLDSLYINAHLVGMNRVSFLPRLHRDHRRVGWGVLCPLRPVYPAQKLIFAQCSRNAGDDGASEEMFSRAVLPQGRRGPPVSSSTPSLYRWVTSTSLQPLTIWHSDGGLVVPCWPGSQGVLND